MFFCWHKWNMWMPIGGLRYYADSGQPFYMLQRECSKCGLIQTRLSGD